MWLSIAYIGVAMGVSALMVLDASLPGGFIEGSGNMRYAQTMTFNTLVLLSLFNLFNARSEEQSAFAGLFSNKWLWEAVGLSLLLQLAVIYAPFLQHAFSTVSLSLEDWLLCTLAGSSVLWLSELKKGIVRISRPGARRAGSDVTS
jgi:Ca2+-transporting ATPase